MRAVGEAGTKPEDECAYNSFVSSPAAARRLSLASALRFLPSDSKSEGRVAMEADRSAKIDSILAQYADPGGPGAALLVVHNGRISEMRYGSADVIARVQPTLIS